MHQETAGVYIYIYIVPCKPPDKVFGRHSPQSREDVATVSIGVFP
jgi:hypothetical protein